MTVPEAMPLKVLSAGAVKYVVTALAPRGSPATPASVSNSRSAPSPAKVVGPLPAEIGHGMSYAAGVAAAGVAAGGVAAGGVHRAAAHAFVSLLTDPAQKEFLASRGFA